MKKHDENFLRMFIVAICLGVLFSVGVWAAEPAVKGVPDEITVAIQKEDTMQEVSDEVIVVTPQKGNTELPAKVPAADEVIIVTPTEEEETVKLPEKLVVADAYMHRGTVTEIKAGASGTTMLTLKRADGTAYIPSTLQIEINADTRLSFPKEDIKKDVYLEVYYSGLEGEKSKYAKAIAVNILTPADMSVFNGEVLEIIDNSHFNSTSLLLKPIGKGMETIFHIHDETQIYLDFKNIKKGDKVNIFYNGIMTMSLPPQSSAAELRTYTPPEASK